MHEYRIFVLELDTGSGMGRFPESPYFADVQSALAFSRRMHSGIGTTRVVGVTYKREPSKVLGASPR